MGQGMVANLLKAGSEVTVYNRTRSKAEDMGKLGAAVADTPALAAKGNGIVITMLADAAAVQDATLSKDGVIEGIDNGSILIDCSTVDPATTTAVFEAAKAKGARFL